MPDLLTPDPLRRRAALGVLARGLLAALAAPGLLPRAAAAHARRAAPHPDPRPGITAARVLPEESVPPRYRDAYRAAREIPQVLDGIRCHCDCAEDRGLRSLLSCFETDMPQSCGICLGEARLALRLHRRGRGLAAIREEVDRGYGSRAEREDRAAHEHR
ncbi:MAG TPA: PCYCGC motif-containing (lipo)protein [Longimicrobiaceae bacterium]|nr:PCYCGC motif-containing (lipo)protein [Longimicrobiaceae bacterium]